MTPAEFAPEYSRTERVRFAALGVAVGGALTLALRLWFFPWLRDFSSSAHCQTVLGVKGTVVLFYGIFVGVPTFAGLVVALTLGRRGYRIVREGRTPPSGEKVFRPTPVVWGLRAKVLGYIQLFAVVPLIVIAVWGSFQAQSLIAQAEEPSANQAPNPSVKGTSCAKAQAAPYVER